MQFVKSILRWLFAVIYRFCLGLLLVVGPAVIVFGTSTQLKSSLKESKIYDNLVSSLIDSSTKTDPKQPNQNTQEKSPFDEPAVKDAAKIALSPTFIQSTSETIIDSMYGWLQGKTDQPEFSVDISGVKKQFTDAVGDYAVTRAQTLPTCTYAQLRQIDQNNIDALKIDCIPKGFDIQSLRTTISDQLNKSDPENPDNILQQSVISPDTLPKNDQGQTPVQSLTENAKQAPDVYKFFSLLPIILGVVAVFFAGIVLLLYDDKRRGIRNLAISITSLGVFAFIEIIIFKLIFSKLQGADGPIKDIDASLKEPVTTLIHSLGNAFNHYLLIFGIVYVVVGVGTLLALHFTKPKTTTIPAKTPTKSK